MLQESIKMPVEMGAAMPYSIRGTPYVHRSISIPNHMLSDSFSDNYIIKQLAEQCQTGCGDMISIRAIESIRGNEITSIYVRLCLEYKDAPILYEKKGDFYEKII